MTKGIDVRVKKVVMILRAMGLENLAIEGLGD